VAVVGRSGSGKSSLVFAGLMPALRQQRTTTLWNVLNLRPHEVNEEQDFPERINSYETEYYVHGVSSTSPGPGRRHQAGAQLSNDLNPMTTLKAHGAEASWPVWMRGAFLSSSGCGAMER
jgi:ABC-type dipeptide/oligopeptide/nickel transport system ATPase component